MHDVNVSYERYYVRVDDKILFTIFVYNVSIFCINVVINGGS